MNNVPQKQRGFSLIEMIAGIVIVAILSVGFLSAFSSVLRTSVSPLQIAVMEGLAAGKMDELLSGPFSKAVAASGTAPQFIVDGTNYWVNIQGQSSVVSGVTYAASLHLTVTVNTDLCQSCVALSGDTFNVQ